MANPAQGPCLTIVFKTFSVLARAGGGGLVQGLGTVKGEAWGGNHRQTWPVQGKWGEQVGISVIFLGGGGGLTVCGELDWHNQWTSGRCTSFCARSAESSGL